MLIVVTCNSLSLQNGNITYNESRVPNEGPLDVYPVDTLASFMCDRGYNPVGPESIICQTSGNWDGQVPTCNQGTQNEKYGIDSHTSSS